MVLEFHSDVQKFQFKVYDDVISDKKTKRKTIKDMSKRHVYLMSRIYILDKSVLCTGGWNRVMSASVG